MGCFAYLLVCAYLLVVCGCMPLRIEIFWLISMCVYFCVRACVQIPSRVRFSFVSTGCSQLPSWFSRSLLSLARWSSHPLYHLDPLKSFNSRPSPLTYFDPSNSLSSIMTPIPTFPSSLFHPATSHARCRPLIQLSHLSSISLPPHSFTLSNQSETLSSLSIPLIHLASPSSITLSPSPFHALFTL